MNSKPLLALAVAALPVTALAADYLGTLKAPQSSFVPSGIYSFANIPAEPAGSAPVDQTLRLKLGYKYSRYFAVESEFIDATHGTADVFASPGNLSSAFRSTGYGVDTVATLPVWRFSFYGRMGAYRGDLRNAFSAYSTSLVGDSARGSRWRYGLGMRYDITKSLGLRAEMERYSAIGASVPGEPESDLFSVGLSWRF
ncbi:MAG TPA: outer membrane beta-barrel protein [Usitatibacter sp.]|nr:outer membrane beta-barrel protein [Usitatibacter sp.]